MILAVGDGLPSGRCGLTTLSPNGTTACRLHYCSMRLSKTIAPTNVITTPANSVIKSAA